MRHRWSKKIKGKTSIRKKLKGSRGFKVYKGVKEIQECEHCGLRRGKYSSNSGALNWFSIVYFVGDNWLSSERIPYPCYGLNDFFTEEDFYV
jgi:hypothetical protein